MGQVGATVHSQVQSQTGFNVLRCASGKAAATPGRCECWQSSAQNSTRTSFSRLDAPLLIDTADLLQ